MSIEVEKNVPFEKKRGNYGKNYPFDKMEVGDSFTIPKVSNRTLAGTQQTLLSAAKTYSLRNKLNWTFSTKTDKETNTVRIWRLA